MADFVAQVFKDPSKVGVVVLCLLAVAAFIKEWVVPGSTYSKGITYRDEIIARLQAENREQSDRLYALLEITRNSQEIRRSSFEQKAS